MACGNSSVEAHDNSSVVACGNSSVEAHDNSSVVAYNNSSVVACGNSSVEAHDFSMIAIIMDSVVIKHLADYSIASLRGVKPKILKQDGTATAKETPKFLNHSFETWLERGYVSADDIRKKLISKKTLRDVEVFTVQDFPKKTESFVVRRGDKFSHGKTIEEAIEDLRYKLSDRDTTRFKEWKQNTEITIEEAIESYRAITGACEFGVKEFCKGQRLPEKITIKEAIKRTDGQYGSKEYREFFK